MSLFIEHFFFFLSMKVSLNQQHQGDRITDKVWKQTHKYKNQSFDTHLHDLQR